MPKTQDKSVVTTKANNTAAALANNRSGAAEGRRNLGPNTDPQDITGAIKVQSSSSRVGKAETRVEKQPRHSAAAWNSKEEGEEENPVPQFTEKLLRSEVQLPQDLDLWSVEQKPHQDQLLFISRCLQPRSWC